MRLPNQKIVNTIMLVIADYQDRLADERVERVGDHGFECQKPGTMAPAPIAGPKIGHALLR